MVIDSHTISKKIIIDIFNDKMEIIKTKIDELRETLKEEIEKVPRKTRAKSLYNTIRGHVTPTSQNEG